MLPKVTPWNEAETLAHEKAALGFYVSSHPLERHRAWASVFVTATTESAKQVAQDGRVVMACLVQGVRPIVVRNGRSADADAVVVGARQHVMPLQYLVEQDAVDESTETDAEDDSRQSERGTRVVVCVHR